MFALFLLSGNDSFKGKRSDVKYSLNWSSEIRQTSINNTSFYANWIFLFFGINQMLRIQKRKEKVRERLECVLYVFNSLQLNLRQQQKRISLFLKGFCIFKQEGC